MGKRINSKRIGLGLLIAALILLLYPLPKPLFQEQYSTVLESAEGDLVSAKIATDGQWRFPPIDSTPAKFEQCILHFEDEYFYWHPGVNPFSILRAIKQNWTAGKVISGGSTLSMQVARLARGNQNRSISQKLIELVWTFRLELFHSKEEILNLYASHAPFGGNVVGLEAASWRYYQRPPHQLSWSESATLAVLPNAPSLIFPGRNQARLKAKRDQLLLKLNQKGVIDKFELELAQSEPLPGKPYALPQESIHLLNRSMAEGNQGKRMQTTLDQSMQQNMNQLINQYYLQLKQNEIHNLALLVLDNKKNEVITYVGNSSGKGEHGHRVDIIRSQRSTGSLLKPLLYASAWEEGLILQKSLLADVPTQFGGYAPKNFDRKYDGAVAADEALIRSLNIPAVRLLKDYGLERFYDELEAFPLPSINKGANYYGLSIMLGGAEASLWELCTTYKGLSNTLRNDKLEDAYSFPFWNKDRSKKEPTANRTHLKRASLWQLVETLKAVNRPGQEAGWENFENRRQVAWKTGTSFGFRDAWAIGITPEYTVGVWVGNADGEGRPGLTGVSQAAPILFDVYNRLPKTSWYEMPNDELYQVEVCANSGYLDNRNCDSTIIQYVPAKGKVSKNCPYNKTVNLNREKNYRVNSDCYSPMDMQQTNFLVLPPLMEYYYKQKEANYRSLPPWQAGCEQNQKVMELISPEKADQIILAKTLGGEVGKIVFEVAHRNQETSIYWHLDNQYLGVTQSLHQIEIAPKVGKHVLSLTDQAGNQLIKAFEIVK